MTGLRGAPLRLYPDVGVRERMTRGVPGDAHVDFVACSQFKARRQPVYQYRDDAAPSKPIRDTSLILQKCCDLPPL